jgi:hypothetical protein
MTPFEKQCEQIKNGTVKPPIVSDGNKSIDFGLYQLITHHFNSKILALGMQIRGVKISDIKKFYGLKGNTASIPDQIAKLIEKYKAELN